MFRIVILLGITLAVEGQSIPPTYSPARRSPALGTAVPPNTPIMIASAGPTIRSMSTMPLTNPPSSPTAPISFAPGQVLTLPPFLASLPTPPGGYSVCHVCSVGYFVKDKSAVVTFNGLVFNCGDIEAAGLQRLFPDAFCTDSLTNAVLLACGCDEIVYSEAPTSTSQAATTNPNTPTSMTASARPTIRSTALMPVANPPPSPVAAFAPITPTAPTTLAPGTALTVPPFLAGLPTLQGGFPFCHVCSVGYFVKDKNALVTFNGVTFSCRDLEALGFQRRIHPAFCTESLTNAVLEACGCDEIFYSAAPSSTIVNPPPSPTAPTTLAPGVVLTFPPIVLVDFPTPDGGFAVCPVCGNGFIIYDTTATVTLSGVSYTCNEIQALGFQRLIPDAYCNNTLLEAVLNECGCQKAFDSVFMPSSPSPPAPPTAPFSPTAPTTLAPGVTFTIPPILSRPVCYVCGEGYFVQNKNASIFLPGVRFTCRDLETAGLQGLLPGDFCTDLYIQEAVVTACGCDEIINSKAPTGSSTLEVTTLAPNTSTAGDELTPSEAPSSNTSPAATLGPTTSAAFTIMSGIATGSVLASTLSLLLPVVL
ncbi:hypothetical protein MHU86_9976 [Fragilaria crotonensis]|nr:hypothetical protein MHU86_9976 [Fragilaria crotonensis]